MNRNDEYNALLTELDTAAAPPALADTVARAGAKAKRSRRVRNFLVVPATAMAVLFVAFVTTVNVSADFAEFCEQVPLLNKLAAAVTRAPSLKIAIEHDHGQTVDGLEQTENGITLKIEYVIAEPENLTIFFSLRSDTYDNLGYWGSLVDAGGRPFRASADDNDAMLEIREYDFRVLGRCQNGEVTKTEQLFDSVDMPDHVMLKCDVYDMNQSPRPTLAYGHRSGEVLASFRVVIPIDHDKIHPGETVTFNRDIVMDGQKFTVASVEIRPTYLQLNLDDRYEKTNTAALCDFVFHAENEKGERFEHLRDGTDSIYHSARDNMPAKWAFRMESPFFSKGEHVTVYITETRWRDKNRDISRLEPVRIDLVHGTATGLPEGATLERVVRNGNSWRLIFSSTIKNDFAFQYPFQSLLAYNESDVAKASFDPTSGAWQGPFEKLKFFDSDECFPADNDEDTTPQKKLPAGRCAIWFDLKDCPVDTVYLLPPDSRWVTLDPPVEIKVK